MNKSCVLITEDKDFGELTYRLRLGHKGIVLIRLSDLPRQERILYAAEMIERYLDELQMSFSVLTIRGLRVR
jgi:predicted nuclease of predicted toxin-antitoxin system